jgi:hypothetical protein
MLRKWELARGRIVAAGSVVTDTTSTTALRGATRVSDGAAAPTLGPALAPGTKGCDLGRHHRPAEV